MNLNKENDSRIFDSDGLEQRLDDSFLIQEFIMTAGAKTELFVDEEQLKKIKRDEETSILNDWSAEESNESMYYSVSSQSSQDEYQHHPAYCIDDTETLLVDESESKTSGNDSDYIQNVDSFEESDEVANSVLDETPIDSQWEDLSSTQSNEVESKSRKTGITAQRTLPPRKSKIQQPNLKEKTSNLGRPKLLPKKMSYQKKSDNFDIKNILDKHLYNKDAYTNVRGRPRSSNSQENIDPLEIYNKLTKDEVLPLLRCSKRADSMLTTLFRLTRNVPAIMLHKFASKNMYKSSSIKWSLISYIEIFNEHFLPVIGEEFSEKQKLLAVFLSFITLHFPRKRVILIFEKLFNTECITEDEKRFYDKMLKNSDGKSKVCIQYTYAHNCAYRYVLGMIKEWLEPFRNSGYKAELEEFDKLYAKIANIN